MGQNARLLWHSASGKTAEILVAIIHKISKPKLNRHGGMRNANFIVERSIIEIEMESL